MMKKSAIQPLPKNFERYLDLVEDTELDEAFSKSLQQLNELNLSDLQALGDKTYAPGKWTIKDIFQHLIDTERIFSYRALRFARKDHTSLAGFDQEPYATHALAGQRTLNELLDEYKITRQSSIALFQSFSDEMLLRKGISSGSEISVLSIGFTTVGHQLHHLKIIREKYISFQSN